MTFYLNTAHQWSTQDGIGGVLDYVSARFVASMRFLYSTAGIHGLQERDDDSPRKYLLRERGEAHQRSFV